MIGIFYLLVRLASQSVFGRQLMLHYPLYMAGGQTLMEGQRHFTDRCLSHLPSVAGKRLLDIGCGNGVQALYIADAYKPGYLYGIDVNETHVRLAQAEKAARNLRQIDFAVDDAQAMDSIEGNSFDLAICTESAHHYPDKPAFLRQVSRVLRPGGSIVIADLMRRSNASPNHLERKLSLFHWPRRRYLETFRDLHLTLVGEEDLTHEILLAFRATGNWFSEPAPKTGIGYALGRIFCRALVALYTLQLKFDLQYCLIVVKKS